MTTDTNYIYRFGGGETDGDPARKDLLGGKGASLAAMSRAGFPVPPGFTISAECCAWVHSHGGQWPVGLRDQVLNAIQQLEATTGRTFGRAPRPLLVAVRSGAAVSMPGMMDTILNCGLNPSLVDGYSSRDKFWSDYADHIRLFAASVVGLTMTSDGEAHPESIARSFLNQYEAKAKKTFPTDPYDSLLQCIQAVFDSWHSDRAVAYRSHHDLSDAVGTAVNVQMMFPSEKSGVLFTADPNHPTSGEMIVEAASGLGEAVVSGAVTPDIFVLDARDFRLKRSTLGDSHAVTPTLDESQLLELGTLGNKVADYFGQPSDIEWGWAEGSFALLQSRAIRGLDLAAELEQVRQAEIARLRSLAGPEQLVWIAHNLGETLVDPTPLTWDIARQFMSRGGGYGRLYDLLGHRAAVPDEFGFLELICGRIYVDPRRAASFYYGQLPLEYDVQQLLRSPESLDGPPQNFNIEKADPLFFFRLPAWIWSLFRTSRVAAGLEPQVQQRFENQAVPKLEEFLSHTATQSLTSFSTTQLLQEFERRRSFVLGEFATESLLPGFFGGLAQARVQKWLTQLLGPEQGQQLSAQLIAGLDADITVEQNNLLFDVAQGRARLDEFLKRFGQRANNEMELSQPRWREEPSYIERLMKGLRSVHGPAPRERHAEQAAERRRVEATLAETLANCGGSSFRERIERDLRQAQRLLPYRELGKFHLMRGYETLRSVLMELSRRWPIGLDLFFLQLDELAHYETRPAEFAALISQRKRRWRTERMLVLDDVIDSRNLDNFGKLSAATKSAGTQQHAARPIAAGVGRGVARVVFDPRETSDLGQDYVLVCPSTDPGWTPLFVNAKALIVERGGVLSHGAIVARDFGIPAVVFEHATRRIPDGARVEVDAHTGRITWDKK